MVLRVIKMCSWNGGKLKNFNNEFLNLHSEHFLMHWEIKLQTENIYNQRKIKSSSKEYVT